MQYVSHIGSVQCLHRGPSSSAPAFCFFVPPAVPCTLGPVQTRQNVELTSDMPEVKETREVTLLILHCTGSSGRKHPWTSEYAFRVQRSQSVRGFLVGAVLAGPAVLLPILNYVSSNRLLQQQLSCLLSTWHWVSHCSTMRHLVTDKHQLCPCPLLEGAGE